MAEKTIDEKIADLEEEIASYRTMLLNNSGYKSIQAAGTEGGKTEFTDPVKIKQLRKEAQNELAHLRLKKSQGYTV